MKLSNGEIFGSKEALADVFDKEWPIKLSFKIATLIAKLNTALESIEKVRNPLIQKYGKPAEDNPNNLIIDETSKDYPKFVAKFNELMAQEVEIEFDIVELPATVDGKDVSIKPRILMALEKFIKLEV
jgi:hypothetical protein